MITNKWINISSIFTIVWTFTGFFSLNNNLKIAIPRDEIHLYIFSSIFIFNLFFYIFSIKNIKIEQNINVQLNYSTIYTLNIIAIVLMMPHIMVGLKVILSTGFGDVRDIVYVGINEGPAYYAVLTRTLPFSIIGVTSLICAIELVKRNLKLLPITLLGIFLITITFGGRFAIFNFAIYYMISFLFTSKKIRKKIKVKYIISAITVLSLITYLRSTNGIGIYNMVILYFSGSLSYLETILANKEIFSISDSSQMYYGYLTLGFILEPITLLIKILGVDLDVPSYIFNSHAQNWTNIGRDGFTLWFNNNTTMFYTFFLDFGYYGFFIGPLFLAIFGIFLYNTFLKQQSYLYFCLLIYYVANIISTPITYDFTSLTTTLTIIFVMLFVKNKKHKEKKNEFRDFEKITKSTG